MKSYKKLLSVVSALAMLGTVVSIPVSASNEDYVVSYEMLVEDRVAQDGTVIPSGSVAVTMSLTNIVDFKASTTKIGITDGYSVICNESNKPVIEKKDLFADSAVAGAVSANGDMLCITSANAVDVIGAGDLFTVYFEATDQSSNDFVFVMSFDGETETAPTVKPDISPIYPIGGGNSVNQWREEDGMHIEYYIVGDTTDDGVINAIDAVNIMQAQNLYATDKNYTPGTDAFDNAEIPLNDVKEYFVTRLHCNVPYKYSPDADQDNTVGLDDADEVLEYAANQGAGGTMPGSRVGKEIIMKIYPIV